MKNRKVKRRYITVFFALLLLVVAFIGGRGIPPAFADITGYSNVLADLQKDKDFDPDIYLDNSKDYSLQVIQIAESTEGGLFVYTYQPCQNSCVIYATQINMSLSDKMGSEIENTDNENTDDNTDNSEDNLDGVGSGTHGGGGFGGRSAADSDDNPERYSLIFINSTGVFAKYKVKDFKVTNDPVRYYNIAAIYRKFNPDYGDTGSTSESIITGKSFLVGKCFKAETMENGQVKYEVKEKKVVEILNPFFAYIEYSNGFKLYKSKCHSHYVAFDTDWQIDFLYEASVSFNLQNYYCVNNGTPSISDPVSYKVNLKYTDVASNPADGWFSNKYIWNRIEKTEDFIKNEDIKDEYKSGLKKTTWVLRYFETDWRKDIAGGIVNVVTEQKSIVSGVTVLRLKFLSKGHVWNLGAVSDIGHDNGKPSNTDTNFDLFEWLERVTGVPAWVWKTIVAILPFAIILPILGAVFPVFGQILLWIVKSIGYLLLLLLKALWWLICLPFKGIANLIEYIKDKKGGG